MSFGDLAVPEFDGPQQVSADLAGMPDLVSTSDMGIADLGMPDMAGGGCGNCNGVCCMARCIDITSDPTNCGGCGNACQLAHATPGCQGSKCVVAGCFGAFKDCNGVASDGCEADSTMDLDNCGACGNKCPAVANGTAGCMAGKCAVASCANGFGHCFGDTGCNTKTDANALNCGACGHVCQAPLGGGFAGCANGACMGGCPNNLTVCGGGADGGGKCTNLNSDPANCGACGNACNSGVCATSIPVINPQDWKLNGSAFYDQNSNTIVLTPASVQNQAGTFIYKNPIITDTFDVQFDFRLSGGSRADGMAFMIEQTGANAVGASGGGLGVVGLNGYAVELDLYDNGNCSDKGGNGNHAGIDTLVACDNMANTPTPLAESADLFAAVGDIGDGAWRTALVHLQNGIVTVSINKMPVVTQALAGFNAGAAYWFGFGGGTGFLADRQEIRNISIKFPSSRCL